ASCWPLRLVVSSIMPSVWGSSAGWVLAAVLRAPKDGAMIALIRRGVGAAATGRSRAILSLAAAAIVAAVACAPVRAEPQRRASEFWLANGMLVGGVPGHRAPVVPPVVWCRRCGADRARRARGRGHASYDP